MYLILLAMQVATKKQLLSSDHKLPHGTPNVHVFFVSIYKSIRL